MRDSITEALDAFYKAGEINHVQPEWWARTYRGETVESITGRIEAVRTKYETAVPPAPSIASDDTTCSGGK